MRPPDERGGRPTSALRAGGADERLVGVTSFSLVLIIIV
jgi:hypothetical protein